MERRTFLKILAGIPILGAMALFASPMLRYLKPTLGPLMGSSWANDPKTGLPVGEGGLVAMPDEPEAIRKITFKLAQFDAPWRHAEFTFGQRSREYTYQHYQITKIPAFVVRLPEDKDGKPDFCIVSRICPHMGCVFNFVEDTEELGKGYNYPIADHPHFGCPCHLSVYDPLQFQLVSGKEIRGKVVSGPAPRPPRGFEWAIEGDDLVITAVEKGGIS